ncbi:hypothetical protein JCM5353_002921 [Sporobolomyces roseus]
MLPPAPPSVTESFDNFRSAIDKLGNVKTLETRQLVHSIQETLYRIYKAQWEAMMDVKVFVNGRGGATERRWTTRIMNDLAGTDSSSSSITQLKGVVKEFKTAVLHKSFKDLHVTVTSIPTSQCQEVECLKLSLLDFKQIDIDKLAAKDDRKGYFLDQIRRALSWIVVHLREWEALGKSAEGKEHLNKAVHLVSPPHSSARDY